MRMTAVFLLLALFACPALAQTAEERARIDYEAAKRSFEQKRPDLALQKLSSVMKVLGELPHLTLLAAKAAFQSGAIIDAKKFIAKTFSSADDSFRASDSYQELVRLAAEIETPPPHVQEELMAQLLKDRWWKCSEKWEGISTEGPYKGEWTIELRFTHVGRSIENADVAISVRYASAAGLEVADAQWSGTKFRFSEGKIYAGDGSFQRGSVFGESVAGYDPGHRLSITGSYSPALWMTTQWTVEGSKRSRIGTNNCGYLSSDVVTTNITEDFFELSGAAMTNEQRLAAAVLRRAQARDIAGMERLLNELANMDGALAASTLNTIGLAWTDEDVNRPLALKLLVRANELQPENRDILDSLGWAYFHAGKTDEAEAFLLKALKAGNHYLIHGHLAAVYLAQKRFDLVREHYDASIATAPESERPELRQRLMEAERQRGGRRSKR